MANTATSQSNGSEAFSFSKVHSCRIHPGIGVARVGNSPDEYFIGPETPCDSREVAAPGGAFKDADGRIKRQAARFRIYAYDKDGNNLGELPLKGTAASGGQVAHVEWKVHLKNKKGGWFDFHSPFDKPTTYRNPDIRVEDGQEPDSRLELVIDPGARAIDGEGNPVQQRGGAKGISFDTGQFRETTVPLGDLKVDEHGRLLVLGGFGNSGSTKSGNPIGADSGRDDYWVNNDFWYDDISDGPIAAKVTLPNGGSIVIDQPQDTAWVIVCPPKYAPGIYSVVTLYDVMRQVAIDSGWVKDDPDVVYYRDIYPILLRATEMAWVNQEAQRGHGFDKRGHFPADPDVNRSAIFSRIRKPLPSDRPPSPAELADAKGQATTQYMPPLSGDGGPRTEGEPRTWLSLLPWQYQKFQFWGDDTVVGREPTFPPLESMNPDEQVEALQRGALEPCAGGPFYPGIEVPWIVKTKELYVTAFRIDSTKHGPGDMTKSMGIPWQATFYDCKDTWWPAVRPDDVIPQDVFEEANEAWRPGQVQVSEALEGRVEWDRGLGVTTLFRRPWQNPAPSPEKLDDPRDSARRGCDDMVRYWHELGFILPHQTAWRQGKQREIVHIEMERRPYAGMDVRELFHCLLNLEEKRTCLPKVEEFVENVLQAARQLQQSDGAFAFMENIRPFEYDESVFDARMQDIYDDCADFAFTENIDGIRVPYDPTDKQQNPYFQTREQVTERIRQLTPFNFLDGSWLRNIHRVGPVDEVNAILFTILKEELGDGVPSQNHANIYQDLCHSFGFYPPPIQSIAFARDPAFLDCAFDSPTFQLGISEFSRRYYPEIIGMSLWLEWTVLELHRVASIVEQKQIGLSSHFYRMHIAIDNAANGHGAGIMRAVKLYLQQIRIEGGEEAVQQHWKRIWDGYVAFAYTFVIVIQQIKEILIKPPSLQQQLEWLITRKAPFGRLNHNEHKLGDTKINSLFADPPALLNALKKSKYIIAGKPDESPFFGLLKFRAGPMYHVFNDDEIKLWRDWIRELGEQGKERQPQGPLALKDRISKIDPALAEIATDAQLASWQAAASDRRIALWAEIASNKTAMKNKISRADLTKPEQRKDVQNSIHDRYETWLGWGMVRVLTFIAAQDRDSVGKSDLTLADSDTAQELTLKEWMDRIRESPNPSVPARALLQSFRNLPDDKKIALMKQLGPDTTMGRVLGARIPGNDGRRGWDTMEAWLKAGCPVPKVSTSKVRPLRLDSTLQEEETHPTGFAIGFGTVH
jgi:hypothetical protein